MCFHVLSPDATSKRKQSECWVAVSQRDLKKGATTMDWIIPIAIVSVILGLGFIFLTCKEIVGIRRLEGPKDNRGGDRAISGMAEEERYTLTHAGAFAASHARISSSSQAEGSPTSVHAESVASDRRTHTRLD